MAIEEILKNIATACGQASTEEIGFAARLVSGGIEIVAVKPDLEAKAEVIPYNELAYLTVPGIANVLERAESRFG